MRKFTKLTFVTACTIFICTFETAIAQNSVYDGVRYRDDCFNVITREADIQYGRNVTLGNDTVDLMMDIYYPEGDTISKRALIVFLPAGGYMFDDKENIKSACMKWAGKGYMVAGINTRLVDSLLITDSLIVQQNMVKASGDAKAAIRFFVEDARNTNLHRADTANIFLAGISSGALTALHTAYMNEDDPIPDHILSFIEDEGGFEGSSSDNSHIKASIKGVLNMSGGLFYSGLISPSDPPIYIVHCLNDPSLPCGYGLCPDWEFPLNLHGGCDIKEEADNVGLANDSYFLDWNSHFDYFFSDITVRNEIFSNAAAFFYGIMNNSISNAETIPYSSAKWQLHPNPACNEIILTCTKCTTTHFVIYNSNGSICYSGVISGVSKINISEFQAGIYFLKPSNCNESIKFVVM